MKFNGVDEELRIVNLTFTNLKKLIQVRNEEILMSMEELRSTYINLELNGIGVGVVVFLLLLF